MKRDESIAVIFFRTKSGNEPVRDFLQELPQDEKKIIGADLKAVQWQWPTGEPLVKCVGHSIYEVRSTLKNRIARILFAQVSNKLALLHAVIKKTQKTDNTDIELAKKRLREIYDER